MHGGALQIAHSVKLESLRSTALGPFGGLKRYALAPVPVTY